MEVVPKFSFITEEVVLSSPASSKCATVVPIEADYYSDNANCQIVSYGNSGNYISVMFRRSWPFGDSDLSNGSYLKYSRVPVCRVFWIAYYGT